MALSGPAAIPLERALTDELYDLARAEGFGLAREDFAMALSQVAAKLHAGKSTRPGALADALRALRLEELALARACAAGHEKAWEAFLTRYRVKLYDIARGITREDSSARELADSIYAELYGMRERDGSRVSKLFYYYGRGSLEGWLRTVLAQEFVNRYRSGKKLVSLDEEAEAGEQFTAPAVEPVSRTDPRLAAATDAALAALNSEDRYILASYFLDERTLAIIGRTLGVHESTISRKVERLAVALRRTILENLVKAGMSRRQAEEAIESDVRDLAVDVRARLTQGPDLGRSKVQEKPAPPFSTKRSSV